MKDVLQSCFSAGEAAEALPGEKQARLADLLGTACRAQVHPRSITPVRRSLIFLCTNDRGQRLAIVSPVAGLVDELQGHEDQLLLEGLRVRMRILQTTARNAAWLRELLPYLKPRPLGLKKSAGFGDRLGLATPGHVRSARKAKLASIFAQQSVRENERTGRSPQEVLDDAMWGVFQEGWVDGFGADADHLKTAEHLAAFAAAGYSFFTVDPGEHVDNRASKVSAHTLEQKLQALPWSELETTSADLQRDLAEKPIDLGKLKTAFRREDILRAAAKYGRAVAHTVRMYRHLEQAAAGRPFEFEMSVDETDSPTTLAEHVYIASELRRLKVKWVSLAPRYVGAFEKGVDYIGDLSEFERSFAEHVAVAETFGPYKLSLHSGSDKFSIYSIASRMAGNLVHLKTAGTSYLEALRTVGRCNPRLFREIHRFAVERYPADRASYHVSAEVGRLADPAALGDGELPGLLDEFHTREVLHVTYGSVLNEARFRGRFFETLRRYAEDYTQIVEAHFDRHLSLLA
jgi:hypothetical protein